MIEVKELLVFDDGTHKWVVFDTFVAIYNAEHNARLMANHQSIHNDSAYGVFINNKLEWLYLSGLGFKVSSDE